MPSQVFSLLFPLLFKFIDVKGKKTQSSSFTVSPSSPVTPWRAAFWNGLRKADVRATWLPSVTTGITRLRWLRAQRPGLKLSTSVTWNYSYLPGDWVRRKSPVNVMLKKCLPYPFFPLPLNTHILSEVTRSFCQISSCCSPGALSTHPYLASTPTDWCLWIPSTGPHVCPRQSPRETSGKETELWGARGKGEVSNLNILLLPAVLINQRPPLFSRWPLLNDKPFWLLKTTPSTSPIAAGVVISPSESLLCPWRFPLRPIHTTLSKCS